MNLGPEDKLILAASKLNPTVSEIQLIEEMSLSVNDWNYFTNNTIQNSIGPLVYHNLSCLHNSPEIPDDTISKLKQTYYKSLSRNMVLYEHFKNAYDAFSSHGFSVIALKGIFLTETVYKDFGLRQMSDIDLLVKKEDIEQCRKILLDLGYVSEEYHLSANIQEQLLNSKHLAPLVLNGVPIELHENIHINDAEYHINIQDYWNRALPAVIHNTACLTLSPNDLIQHLCLHLYEHFITGKIMLYSFCDIVEVLKAYQHQIDWVAFEESCKLYNCQSQVFSLLFLASKYFNAPIPDVILQKAEIFCDTKTENLFISYLTKDSSDITWEVDHQYFKKVKKIHGLRQKLIFSLGIIFPPKEFMVQRYRINSNRMIVLYRVVRIYEVVAQLLLHLRNKVLYKFR